MMRRKNLERAVVLGLLLSTSVYGNAWAEEISNIENGGIFVGYEFKNGTTTVDRYQENYIQNDITNKNIEINKFGIIINTNNNAKSGNQVVINISNGDLKINLENRHATNEYAKAAITVDNNNKNKVSEVDLKADNITIKLDENAINNDSRLDDYNGISMNMSGENTGKIKFTADLLNADLKTKGDFIIDGFERGISAGINSELKISNAQNIIIRNNDYSGINVGKPYSVSNMNSYIELNADSISFFNNQNGIISNQNTNTINLIADNSITIKNDENYPIDTSSNVAIYGQNNHLSGQDGSNIKLDAGKNIIIKNFEEGLWNDDSEYIDLISSKIQISDVNRGIVAESSRYGSYVTINTQEKDTMNGSIDVYAEKNAVDATGSKTNVVIMSTTNNLLGAEEAVVADSNAKVNVNGKQNYIANSFSNEQTGNGSYALHSNDKAEITVTANKDNTIIGDTEAVLAEKGSIITITGKNNNIGNSSNSTSDIATLSEKENYALHAVKDSTISVTAQDGGINNIQSDGFRTVFADSASSMSSNATININGAVNIINKNALENVEQEKIAVVAANESNTLDVLEKYYKKGIVNINLNGTDTLVDTQGNFVSGNRIVGSVIAGKNGIVNINSNLSEDVSTFSRSGDNSKGSIAVYGNVMAGNNGELNLDLGAGGYLSGRVDDYQDANLKDGIGFFNPEFSREVTEAGTVNLTMGEGSTWNVTGQSWVTKLDGSGTVDMRNGGANDTSHAVHVGTLTGNHTFVMDLNSDDHNVSDMLFIKDEANSSGEQTIYLNSVAGIDTMADGEKLRFATVNADTEKLNFVGQYNGENSYENNRNGVMMMDNGVMNTNFVIEYEKYDATDAKNENKEYNGGTDFNAVKPGDAYVDTNYANGTNWYLTRNKAGDETSDAGKTIINMSKVNYSNAIYMDRLNKRLGEARYINPEEEQGMWVRIRHDRIGKDDAFRSQNTMYEMGYDEKQDCDNGERRVGFAIDYMDGKAEYSGIAGDGDVKRYGLWLYDTWLGDKGHYTDYVLKWGHLENDFDIYTMTRNEKVSGDYSNNVFSASAEYGKKNDMGSGWYFEPQAQLQFARVTGANYVTSQDTKVSLDGINSLIGRAGFRLGKDFGEEKQSTVYFKADVLHEFLGDQDITATDATGTLREEYENEGTWYDVGFGFATALGNSSYAFMDFEKSFGNDNDETYQINAGVQWTF